MKKPSQVENLLMHIRNYVLDQKLANSPKGTASYISSNRTNSHWQIHTHRFGLLKYPNDNSP